MTLPKSPRFLLVSHLTSFGLSVGAIIILWGNHLYLLILTVSIMRVVEEELRGDVFILETKEEVS